MSKNNLRTGVFGQTEDMLVFGLPILISILVGKFFPRLIDSFLVISIVNEAHVFIIFFLSYGSRRIFYNKRNILVLTPIVALIGSIIVMKLVGQIFFNKLFVLLNVYHLIRQQQAWFFISNSKTLAAKSSADLIVNNMGIYASTWGLFLVFMTDADNFFLWKGDLFILPQSFYIWIKGVIYFSISLYILYYSLKFFRNSNTNLSQHLFLLIALVTWGIGLRLFSNSLNFALVAGLSHSLPYYYLCYRYFKQEKERGGKFYFPVSNINYTSMIIFTICALVGAWEYSIPDKDFFENQLIFFVFISASLSHYYIDGFFWKKIDHPEGARAFSFSA